MVGTERILIDTSALYAMRSASDLFHARASSSYRRFVDGNVDFWTTSYVLVETVALLHRRLASRPSRTFPVAYRFRRPYGLGQWQDA